VTRTSTRLTTTLVAISAAALLGTACGDDDGGSPDANTTPDGAITPDAARPDATPPRHTGTVAISEVTVTTPDAPGVRGGAISIIYDDPADAAGETLFGTSPPINTCLVKKYTPTNAENPPLDEGIITLGGSGLLKPVGECAFAAGLGYECTIASGTDTVAVANIAGRLYGVQISEDYSDTDLVGSSIRLAGFTGDTAQYNGTFSVVGQVNGKGTTTLQVIIASQNTIPAAAPAEHDYRLLSGFGPVPTAGLPFAVDTDFLGGAGTAVTITKPETAAPGAPALAINLPPAGEGFELDGEGDAILAHEFPFTAGPVTFTCGETCGALPTGATAGLQVIAVSGRTTDVTLPAPSPAAPGFIMPPVSATDEAYATFQCTFFETPPAGSNTFTATMPQAAVEAILSTGPTRIETRVFRFSASQTGANVLIGHGVVGHSSLVNATAN
jgi:hypothetical protein